MLRDNFKHFVTLRQRAILGSLIVTSEYAGRWRSFERRDQYHIEASNGLSRAPYLLSIASDTELQQINSSAYVDRRSVYSVVESFTSQRATEERAEELLRERDAARERADELVCERDAARERADECERDRERERERAREFAYERDAARSALTEKERGAWKMALAAERDGAALTPERPRDDEAELNLQRAQLSHLDRERRFLAQELTKAYRRPWRPIKYFLSRQILTTLSFATIDSRPQLHHGLNAQLTRGAQKGLKSRPSTWEIRARLLFCRKVR